MVKIVRERESMRTDPDRNVSYCSDTVENFLDAAVGRRWLKAGMRK